MGVVGEERRAGLRTRARHDPIVRSRARRLAAGPGGRENFGRERRLHLRAQGFLFGVAGEPQRHEFDGEQRVRRRPGRRAVAEDEQLRRRQGARGGRGVDPRSVGFEQAARVFGQRRDVARRDPRQAQRAEIAVGPEEARAEDRGQFAAARQARQGELRGPVLAVNEAEAEPGVAFALRGDVGDPVAVAADLDGRLGAGHDGRPVPLRQRGA